MTSPIEIYPLITGSRKIVTDSRHATPGSIFIALKGDKFNGNLFASDALMNGAEHAIVDDPEVVRDERYLLVNDGLGALQELAIIHRKHLRTKIIGITGSNGKTTTKELISRVLSTKYHTGYTRGNLNNHIGVPLTILSLWDEEMAIVEMGANHPGEIARLCEITRPHFGIITNIGKAHLEGFGSLEGVAKAKSELYRFVRENAGTLFVNTDHDLLVRLATDAKKITYGSDPEADCTGSVLERFPVLEVGWKWRQCSGITKTNLYGDYNFENVLAAITVGLHFSIDPEKINLAIHEYVPENNRSQWINTRQNQLMLDAYNANPSSMKAAVLQFSLLKAPFKMVILGDMMELGTESRNEHAELVRLIRSLSFQQVILIGNHFCQAAGDGQETCFKETSQAAQWLRQHPVNQATVLLKGSRLMQLETLKDVL